MVLCLGIFAHATVAQKTDNAKTNTAAATTTAAAASINWNAVLKQTPEWYGSDEAVRVGDSVLLYQRETGGWPKNIDMTRVLAEREKAAIVRQKRETDSNIDNGATYTQLRLLARVFTARRRSRHARAFLLGLDYLLAAQYPNGGWPQYYPRLTGYYRHVTFNDDAMTGVLWLLKDVAAGDPPFAFVDAARRARSARAVEKGIGCILATQVVVDGHRTVWCAQHEEVTLAPAGDETTEVLNPSTEAVIATAAVPTR